MLIIKNFIRLFCTNKETIIAVDTISYIDREDTQLFIRYKNDNVIRSYKFHSSHEAFIAFEQIWKEVNNND